MYLTAAILITVLMSVVLLHVVSKEKTGQNQSSLESILPSGKYLPDATVPIIRVVLKSNGFGQLVHSEVALSAESGLVIKENGESSEVCETFAAGEVFKVKPDDARFQAGSIWVEPQNPSEKITIGTLTRGYGTPSYRGKLELFSTAEGIVIVNELPVETYLYGVVPSEMPASYEEEALKCQAVCARSYAYCQMLTFSYPEYQAHVDDSVSFQVYGNSKEQETTNRAVDATANQKLRYQGEVVKTYYYSTSCGASTSIDAWGSQLTEENQYLCGIPICDEEGNAYEEGLPWYRWEATVPEQTLSDLVELNTGKDIGTLKNIIITKKGTGGIALQIVAEGTDGNLTIDTENQIRSALGGSGYQIKKQDETMVNSTKLLPSAFFTIAKSEGNYIIKGGGYGHGIGMSQNGANEMAKAGKTYKEILTFFYPGTEVESYERNSEEN